jgi:MFS transporter, DHA3 family, macrolide efflux protein
VSFVVSILRDSFRLLAVNVWIFQATEGSPGQRLVLVLLGNLPGLLLGGLSGVLADRWDRYRILVGSDLLRWSIGLGLAWCAVEQSPYAALALVALGNGLGVFFASSAFSLLPRLVSPDRLARTNGLMETSQWVVQIIGPSLAAFTLFAAGAATAFLVDSVSFLVSDALLWRLRNQFTVDGSTLPVEAAPADQEAAAAPEEPASHWQSFLDGVRLIWNTPEIRALLLASYGVTFIAACTNFTLIFVVANSLGENAATLGVLYSLNGIVAVGAAAATSVFLSDAWLGRVMAVSMLGLCAAQVVMGTSPNLWVLGVGVVISALSNAPYNVSVTTLYMRRVPAAYLGRVEGVDTMVDNAVSIGAFAFSVLIVSVADARLVFLLSASVALPSLLLAAVRVAPSESVHKEVNV